VTAQNIANVNTPGYSRQTPVLEALQPLSLDNLIFGQGVDTTQVIRTTDQFIENQLMQQRSKMSLSEEMENYSQALEGIFNENLGTSISSMLSDFWNLWHDISNNPSGVSERISLYEHGILLSEQFNAVDGDLANLETDLTNSLSSGIGEVNRIANEIAQLNEQIVGMETGGSIVNDLRDKRNAKVSELSEYLDVNTFDQDNGTLTVVTARGCILVQGNSSYGLEMGGDNGDRVKWQSSGGTTVDITNYINNGKLGGWLTMRDEIIAKYKLDLSSLAEEFVWAVNSQHSQGVGLELFQPSSSITGTYKTSSTLGDLNFGAAADGYVAYSGTLKLWIGDGQGENMQDITIDLDSVLGNIEASSSLAELRDTINAQINDQRPLLNGTVAASLSASGDTIIFTADATHTFGFSDDTSNILAALGINTFFKGTSAGAIDVTDTIGSDKAFIAAARIGSDGSYASGDNSNALAIADLQYTFLDIPRWDCDRITGNKEGNLNATIENYYHAMVGSIGITASSISSERTINEEMVNRLSVIRDSISAVSLDEEMTNLIKFQSAYEAAAKLISIADEMLDTLLRVK
jgi:flagellar hook-associated protein 1 FlgK